MSTKEKSLADKLFPITKTSDELGIVDISPEQRKLQTETYDFSIATLFEYLKSGSITIPEFQRNYVWNRSQASRLIESLIIKCPIPVIYLNQERDETLSVIDGNQRLTAIKLYLEDDFELSGLSAYPELEGHKFTQLDPRFRRHILNRTLRCITILKETHPQIKFDVFERINTGAVKLNPQEVRHGVYHGNLIKLVDELSNENIWKQISGHKNDNRMRGSELVLRYLALTYDLPNYKKPLSNFLNNFCEKNKNLDEKTILKWKSEFLSVINLINQIFDENAFKVLDTELKPIVKNINSALFDAVMVGFTKIKPSREQIEGFESMEFLKDYQGFISTEDFMKSISAGTSATASVKNRIKDFSDFLKTKL